MLSSQKLYPEAIIFINAFPRNVNPLNAGQKSTLLSDKMTRNFLLYILDLKGKKYHFTGLHVIGFM